MPRSSPSQGGMSVKHALTKAILAPVRIRSREVRWPSTALMESMTMDLPAPVSPVRALKPGRNSMSAHSMMAIFSMWSNCSICVSLRCLRHVPRQRSISLISSVKSRALSVSRMISRAVSSPARDPTRYGTSMQSSPRCEANGHHDRGQR